MSWLGPLLKVIGGIVVNFLLGLVAMGKKPKKVHTVGGDKGTRDALDKSVSRSADPGDDSR